MGLLPIPYLMALRAGYRGLVSVFRAEADGPPHVCPCRSPPRLVACPFEILLLAAVAAARARKLEARLTCPVPTAELGDVKESSMLA